MKSRGDIDVWSGAAGIVAEMLNIILPGTADGKLPGAGSLGIADFISDRLSENPILAALFANGISTALNLLEQKEVKNFASISHHEKVLFLRVLEDREPEFFSALVRHTYIGYYTHPQVPPYYGLSDKPPHPDGYSLPADDPAELDALLAPVRLRGNCYRDC